MQRIKTTPITNFFAKRQYNEDTQNHSNLESSPVHVETEMRGNLNSSKEPILDRLTEYDVISLPKAPGLRRKLSDFHINDRDIIRREYIRRCPCQPLDYNFPKTNRKFVLSWFEKFEPWLEYSKEKDAAFCFVCYLFKSSCTSGGEAFVNERFRTWSKTSAFDIHVGNHMSAHNNAMKNYDIFIKQKSSIACCFENYSKEVKSDYRIRLETSIEALRFLCLQGLAARGHNESDQSLNQGNFLELLKLMAKRDSNVARVVLEKSPGNCTLTSSQIQKDIELDGSFFAILADESADISDKEQMALWLRYVDKMGKVKERLLGIVRVGDTISLTLKAAIEKLLIENSLTLSSVRGQGYDGAKLNMGEIASGTGLNQEKGLSRPGDTCWGSHFKTILNVFALYSAILDVLDAIGEFCDGSEGVKVEKLAYTMQTFDFVFVGQLMIKIFGITNVSSLALQRRDQDIVNAIALVDSTKRNLQKIRDDGWDVHMEKVESFCLKHEISIPTMDDVYVIPGRYKRGRKNETNLHHFRVEVFLSLIDQILQEIDSRFDEVSKELLICITYQFDITKLVRLAHFYPNEFSNVDLLHFECQLENFIEDVRHDDRFLSLKNLNELSMKLVETKKHLVHMKVYLLLKLVLLLPVATASVERAFSAMTYIKNRLRNSMGDQSLNDNLLAFVERDLFCEISDEDIVNHFQNMRTLLSQKTTSEDEAKKMRQKAKE
ncbi:hypothetical protein RND81_06G116300 [Saponaria officinalis]|uniref:TTF-type domain-containing protein n=1 Tax=Saponaria officinalis TaxID=3572 RepID=A0AAW1K8S7_SAPOF